MMGLVMASDDAFEFGGSRFGDPVLHSAKDPAAISGSGSARQDEWQSADRSLSDYLILFSE